MKNFNCNKCGSIDLFIKENGTQVGLYCSDCGKWQKWLSKDERLLAEEYIKNFKSIKPIAEGIMNDCENQKLLKVLEFVKTEEDRFYNYSFEAMREGNRDGHIVHTAQASSYQMVRYFVESLLED